MFVIISKMVKLTSHEECRYAVCFCCLNKARQKNCAKITGQVYTLLNTQGCEFVEGDITKPAVLCSGCYIKLKQGNLKEIVDYTKLKINVQPNTRQGLVCECKICQVARFR